MSEAIVLRLTNTQDTEISECIQFCPDGHALITYKIRQKVSRSTLTQW